MGSLIRLPYYNTFPLNVYRNFEILKLRVLAICEERLCPQGPDSRLIREAVLATRRHQINKYTADTATSAVTLVCLPI